MTNSPKFHLHHGATGAAITVRVAANCKQNRIAEIGKDGTLTIELKTPDSGEGSNSTLIKYLADALKVPGSGIEIVAGKTSQDKLVTILNIDADALQERILKIAG